MARFIFVPDDCLPPELTISLVHWARGLSDVSKPPGQSGDLVISREYSHGFMNITLTILYVGVSQNLSISDYTVSKIQLFNCR